MKSLSLALALALTLTAAFTMAPSVAEAKRLGGGSSSGMQRSTPARSTPDAAPAKPAQATPAPATAGAAPAAPKRSWMGPLAGLAAGLGLAALMSHFGMGAEFGNLITMVLLGLLAFIAIRFVMSRMRASSTPRAMAASNGMQFAGAGTSWSASASGAAAVETPAASVAPVSAAASLNAAPLVPVGFDQVGFERIAKMIFIRLQAANDSADLNDLRQFTTPELFASIKLDLQDRSGAAQHTDVVRVDSEVVDFSDEAEQQIVSVRFHGLISEAVGASAEAFNEIWHLVKPRDGSREWAIAGIQQTH